MKDITIASLIGAFVVMLVISFNRYKPAEISTQTINTYAIVYQTYDSNGSVVTGDKLFNAYHITDTTWNMIIDSINTNRNRVVILNVIKFDNK